jgi:DNA repair protein RecO (recombination protein O)
LRVAYHQTTGIILRTTDFSETSQVVAIITPDLGQIHALAKGARKPRKDGRLPLDILSSYHLVLSLRQGGHLHLLYDWSLKDYFPGLRRELRGLWSAFYAAELLLCTTSENLDDGPLHGALNDLLLALERQDYSELPLCRFLAGALRALGNLPIVERCAQCGNALHGLLRFSACAGGVLCGDCRSADPAAFQISRGALAVMRRLELEDQIESKLRIMCSQAQEIRRAFAEQIQYHLGHPLRTERFLASLLGPSLHRVHK